MEKNLPQHIAIIPDGNRRWARSRGLISVEGHREGFKRFREIAEAAFSIGIPFFTFWGASEDNLTKRSKIEVNFLVTLFQRKLEEELRSDFFTKNQIRVRVIGRWETLLNNPAKLKRLITEVEGQTRSFQKNRLTILFGYDGRSEMLEAVKKIKKQSSDQIDFDTVKQALWTNELPDVDLVIRTGGEPHWSAGFMMWLTANSQFYFTEKFWPEFTEKEFTKAIKDFQNRERRFGK